MKIGIFPGSFNPFHIGHLALANYICEFENYDEIWFLITPQNPQKDEKELISQELRLQFVENAIKGYEKLKICTIEWELPKPTYTVTTLQKLRIKYPQNKFELIIGSDNWEVFHRWKDFQVILNNFKLLVYPRRGNKKIIQINHPNVRLCNDSPKIDISSSFIRNSIKNNKDVRFFMPNGIYEAILNLGIFKTEVSEEIEVNDQKLTDDDNK